MSWMEQGPMISRKRLSSVKISRWISLRARAMNSAWISDLGSSFRRAAGEGRARVSTTLMSDVFCTGAQNCGEHPVGQAFGGSLTQLAGGQRKGRSRTPTRPAIAFLVTPKLLLGRRSVTELIVG